MNEIVKYDTELNKLDYSSLSTREQNIFMAILAKVKNKEGSNVTLSYDEIITLADLKSNKLEDSRKHDIIESTKDKLFNITCDIKINDDKTGQTSISFHIFDTWINSYPNKCLTLSVSPIFAKFLNNPQKFLSFPLCNFVNLNSNYSKTLYRLLKQFDNVGSFKFHSVEQFRNSLGIPDTMPNKKIKGVIEQAVKEINSKGYITDLTYSINKDASKKGAPIKSIDFKWKIS